MDKTKLLGGIFALILLGSVIVYMKLHPQAAAIAEAGQQATETSAPASAPAPAAPAANPYSGFSTRKD